MSGFNQPFVEQVHYRIMHYVQRVGEISKVFCHCPDSAAACVSICAVVRIFAAGGKYCYCRENEGNAQCFIYSIYGEVFAGSEERNRENHKKQGAAEDKCIFWRRGFAQVTAAVDYHSKGEREQHADKSSEEIYTIKCPADTYAAVAGGVCYGECRKADTEYGGKAFEPFCAESSDEQGVKDVAYVFKEQRPAWTVERIHFSVSTYVMVCTGPGRDKEHAEQQCKKYVLPADGFAVPVGTPSDAE